MNTTLVLLTLVVIGLAILFAKKNPQGFVSFMQKAGVGLVVTLITAVYLIVLAIAGLFTLLTIVVFLIGKALSFVGEKGTMFSVPLFETILQVGLDAKDRALQRD